uniref:Protein kinase C n=1 Tax=Caenorhabditis japonica TaxID=281687 RepID=A0A8R1HR89_CAEJA
MLWVILTWGLLAVICYFALNHLGSTGDSTHTSSSFGGLNTGKEGSSNGVSHGSNGEWSNEIVSWLYSNFHKVPAPMDAWIKSLNEAAKKVTSPTKCEVLFEGFGDHNDVLQPPKISNVRVEHGPRDHLTVRSNVHLPCVKLRLVSSQRTPERMIVSNYDVSIVDLRGEVECRMACIANQLYLMGCFSGRPEMDIELRNTDPSAQYQVSLPMVEESIRRCLLSAVTNINLSEELPEERNTFADTFSRTIYSPPTQSPNGTMRNSYNGYDSNLHVDPYGTQSSHRSNSPSEVPEMFKKLNESHLISPSYNANSIPNKMRIKIIKAGRLGKEVSQPFVNVEIDEPAQKYSTSKGINSNPYWEEQFDFDLTPATEEILFEIYEGNDKLHLTDDEGFLGLAIVNFEEIRRSGETIHTLKLQGRPYRKDAISGDVTVQFDFYYDPHSLTTGKLTDAVKVINPNGSEFRETLTTQRRPIYDPHDNLEGHEPIIPSKTTTVIVKTVSQALKEKPTIQSVHGSLENAVDPATQRILDQQFKNHNDPKTRELEAKLQSVSQSMSASNTLERSVKNGSNGHQYSSQMAPPEFHEDFEVRQSRDKTKKVQGEKRDRSFFGELRDRLSGRRGKSQKRSKSVDLENQGLEEAVSLPPSRDPSRTRYAVSSNDKYRETHSVGGRSGESTKSLYQHSTLILELDHDKQTKYFLIPPAMLTEPAAARLMRKGKKLHIYNDHTFVAVKVKGGANCNVCQQRIRSSFSKQAYQCRDCKLVCHKSCHYKTDAFCTQSTVSKLQIAKDVDWAHFLSHYQLEEFISSEGGL